MKRVGRSEEKGGNEGVTVFQADKGVTKSPGQRN